MYYPNNRPLYLFTRTAKAVFLALVVFIHSGCLDSSVNADESAFLRATFDFESNAEGWTAGFSDYPSDKTAEDLELEFDRKLMPEETGVNSRALYISGKNESDDLFMFLKRKMVGLQPKSKYRIILGAHMASNAPTGCAGIGGSPGEAVVVKVGASVTEPVAVDKNGFYEFNIDIGSQSEAGENTRTIGNIANGSTACSGDVPYKSIVRSNETDPLIVTTDINGEVWVFIGTDSGFEGKTSLYYNWILIDFIPVTD